MTILLTGTRASAQQMVDIFSRTQPDIINCPNNPTIGMPVELATQASNTELVNYIQITFEFNETVLGAPQVGNLLPGWIVSDITKSFQNLGYHRSAK